MKYDQDGFLYGGRSIIGGQGGELPGLPIGAIGSSIRGIKYDTSEILKHLRASKGLFSGGVVDARIVGQRQPMAVASPVPTGSRNGRASAAASESQATAVSPQPSRTQARDSTGRFVSTKVAAAAIEAMASGQISEPVIYRDTPTNSIPYNTQQEQNETGRDSNGRFTKKPNKDKDDKKKKPSDDGKTITVDAKKLSAAIGNAYDASSQVDPIIASAKEAYAFASGAFKIAEPVIGLVGKFSFGSEKKKESEQKKSTSFLKRILAELRQARREKTKTDQDRTSKKPSTKDPSSGGDSWLSTLIAGVAGAGAGGIMRLLLSKGAGALTKISSAARGLPLIGGVLSTIGAGASAIAIDSDKSLNDDQRRTEHSKNIGNLIGGLGGLIAGGIIGGPIGAVFGAWLGGKGGELIGEAIGEAMGDSPASGMLASMFKRIRDSVAGNLGISIPGVGIPQAAGAPGYAGTPGSVAALGESGGRLGVVSSGVGDKGGISYGKFQMSSNAGTVDRFIKESKYGKYFDGLQVGTRDFASRWKELETSTPGFVDEQRGFIMRNNVAPAAAALKAQGIDLSSRGGAVQEMLFSTANQFGGQGGASLIASALAGKKAAGLDDISLIRAVQQYKISNNASLFRSSSQDVQAGTLNRARNELVLLSGMAGMEAGRPGSALGAMPSIALPNVPAMSVPKVQSVSVPEIPRIEAPAIPAGPSMQSQQRPAVVAIPAPSAPVQQEVSDRSIAHTAAGGIGRGVN